MLWWTTAFAHVPVLYSFGPEDDWCAFLNGAERGGAFYGGGDIIVLREGTYAPCAFTAVRPTEQNEYTLIQSENRDTPAVFVHDGTQPVLSIAGERVLVFDLVITDIPEGQVGVRIEGSEIGVRYSSFTGQGTAVQFVEPTVMGELANSRVSTANGVDVVCEACDGVVTVRDSLFEDVELGVSGIATVRNTVFDEGGRAVDLVGPVVVEGNLFRGQQGVRVAGEAVVLNNIFDVGGTAIELAQGQLLANTVARGEVVVDAGIEAVSNVLPIEHAGANQLCTAACFDDGTYLPTPTQEGGAHPLIVEDFCGEPRPDVPTAGALEPGDDVGPWEGFKSDFACTQLLPPAPVNPTPEPDEPASGTCGCRSGQGPTGWLMLLVLPWIRRSTSGA